MPLYNCIVLNLLNVMGDLDLGYQIVIKTVKYFKESIMYNFN